MKLEERLNEIIDEKGDRIEKLEKEVESLNNEKDFSRVKWQQHSAFQNDDFYKPLPYPRLEMRLSRLSLDNWYEIEWVYGLVYKHSTDTFSEKIDLLCFIPMGRTTSNGGRFTFSDWLEQDGSIQLPFRDGMHIYAESLVLNLPAYITCYEEKKWNKIENKGWGLDCVPKMKSP